MTELEKLYAGKKYNYSDPEISQLHNKAFFLTSKINNTIVTEENCAYIKKLLKCLIPDMDDSVMIILPFRCDIGSRIKIGKNVTINYNCSFLDNGGIEIGNNTLIGPDCHILTSQHPIDYKERRKPEEKSLPIKIGDDCWLGGNVTVCPGVTIGNRVIVAAGSVVVNDVPDDVMVAGNPAVIKKKLQ